MTCRCKSARRAAETAAQEALEHGSNAFADVVNYVAPRARQAGHHAAEVVAPIFEDTLGRVSPVFDEAMERVSPVIEDARGRVSPVIEDARGRVSPVMAEVVDRVQPAVHHAYDTVSDKVHHDVYPLLLGLLEQAGDNPSVAEASRRGRSAVAALRGDLSLPDPAPARHSRSLLGWLLTALGVATLIGVVVVAVRTVLGTHDDGWSPQEPSRPRYDEDEAVWGDSPFSDEVEAEPDVDTAVAVSEVEAEQVMVAEGGPVDEPLGDIAETATRAYGEGAYVGDEPPEGFTIKGSERSMKFHTPDAAAYGRTKADVWFVSEDAAQAAGFTRASR